MALQLCGTVDSWYAITLLQARIRHLFSRYWCFCSGRCQCFSRIRTL